MSNVSECGFGYCAADPACRDKQCPEHPCQHGFDPNILQSQADFMASIEADARFAKRAVTAFVIGFLALAAAIWGL